MRKRKPRLVFIGDYESEDFGITASEVIDSDEPEMIDTGILDASGRPIYRQRPRVKMGFVV